MQEPPLIAAINVRAPCYLAARTDGACWRCGRTTPLIGLALAAGHEIRLEESEAIAARGGGDWQVAGVRAWIFFVEYLPLPARRRLQALSPLYRYAYNRSADGAYWINTCAHCGAAQDDDDLHGEPDVAFMPLTERAAARIELLRIDEPLGAWAGGYSVDPPLFDAMRWAPARGA